MIIQDRCRFVKLCGKFDIMISWHHDIMYYFAEMLIFSSSPPLCCQPLSSFTSFMNIHAGFPHVLIRTSSKKAKEIFLETFLPLFPSFPPVFWQFSLSLVSLVSARYKSSKHPIDMMFCLHKSLLVTHQSIWHLTHGGTAESKTYYLF